MFDRFIRGRHWDVLRSPTKDSVQMHSEKVLDSDRCSSTLRPEGTQVRGEA